MTTDPQGMKAVAYANLTALLVEALKEQDAEVACQRARIEALEARLAALEMAR